MSPVKLPPGGVLPERHFRSVAALPLAPPTRASIVPGFAYPLTFSKYIPSSFVTFPLLSQESCHSSCDKELKYILFLKPILNLYLSS